TRARPHPGGECFHPPPAVDATRRGHACLCRFSAEPERHEAASSASVSARASTAPANWRSSRPWSEMSRETGLVPQNASRAPRGGGGQPLALSSGERDPALADDGVVSLGQPLDDLVCLCQPCDALHLCVVETRRAERDVLARGRGEEERVLGDDADCMPEGRQ